MHYKLNLHAKYCVGESGVSLWEDRVMAGFMPLKENLSVKDTFVIPEFSKLSTDVRPYNVQCSQDFV